MIEQDLRVVFCGTGVGSRSARAGAYYAGPGNSFWRTLHEIGLTPHELEPGDYRELPRYGIGLTDVSKVRSGSDADLGEDGFDVARLADTLKQYTPQWIAFNGKKAATVVLGRPVDYGEQADQIGTTRTFVLPSTSGAARGFWDVGQWHGLAQRVSR